MVQAWKEKYQKVPKYPRAGNINYFCVQESMVISFYLFTLLNLLNIV